MGCYIKSVRFVNVSLHYVRLWWIYFRILWHYHFISNYMFSVFMHRFPVRCQMIDIYNVHRPWTLNQRNINVIAIEFEAPLKKLATVPSTIGHGPVREWFAPDDVQEASALLNWNKLVFNMFAASYDFPGSPATGACKKDVSKGRRPGFKANKERQICILPIMWHSSTNSCTEALVAGSYTFPQSDASY